MESEKQTVRVEILEERCIWPESRRHSYRHNELLYEETFEFEEGKMYGILGEHGEGGGGLSWLLSGRDVIRDEKITVFGKEYKKGETVEEGWYLGEGIPGMDKSARKEIAAALKMSKSRLSVQDIVDKFHLTEDRLDVKVQYYSWEIWRLSAAIGYALGKKIFCFPAIDTLMVTEIVMSAEEQIAKLKGTVVADEIALDFSEIGMVYAKELLEKGWLTQEQYIIVKSIDEMLDIMSERNGLWTEDALLNAEEWDQCRKKARLLLEMLE